MPNVAFGSRGKILAAALLFPPLGLWRLWRGEKFSIRRLLATLAILAYVLPYTIAVFWLLWKFGGLKFEMKGSSIPLPTFSPTVPDFERLEASRSQQTKAPATAASSVGGTYWTEFRGPQRDGHYTEHAILTDWPKAGPRQLWKQPVGGGYASFVVAQGVAYTIELRREQEAITAYDVGTGSELWAHTYPAWFKEWMGGDGPRATPTWHEGKLYSLGAMGELRCLDARDGKMLWRQNLLQNQRGTNLMYGLSAAPLIVDEKVITLGGEPLRHEDKTIFAHHKDTGAPLWSVNAGKMAYTSPMLVTFAGERQLLIVGANQAMGVAPADSRLLWHFPFPVTGGNNIAQPLLAGTNRFVITASYGTGAALVEISKTGDGFASKEIWANKSMKCRFASPVLWEGFLYGLDEDRLVCLDAATGERKWKDGNYGYGQLLLASGHLVILTATGELALVKATPAAWTELARLPALKGKTWNSPALADGRLLIRNSAEMACYDVLIK
ncbi:MAG: PQQ-binding-like beta-propeller repeat protein [Verrucomicrobia bacterium]|nr:PQQ-binding-like beta-propeller repeat protein [Verrucomicrobiota bacterium]